MTKNNPLNAYRETRITTANQGELIVMLYDGAINQLKSAVEWMREGHFKYDRINNALGKAQDIITELTTSLNMEAGGEIASNLMKLYLFFNQQIRDANLSKDESKIEAVIGMLTDLRGSWAEIASEGPAEGKAQTGFHFAG